MESIVLLSTLLLCAIGCLAQPYRPAGYYDPAPVDRQGRVIDTPQVAAAKAAHMAAFQKAASRTLNPYNAPSPYNPTAPAAYQPLGVYSDPGFYSARIEHGPYGYQGPPAPLANDGQVMDTPEVEAAKAAHFEAYNQAASRSYDAPASQNDNEDYSDYGAYNNNNDDDGSSSSEEGQYEGYATTQYRGPLAPLGQDGRVIDEPRVAALKAERMAALQKAQIGHVPKPVHQGYYVDY